MAGSSEAGPIIHDFRPFRKYFILDTVEFDYFFMIFALFWAKLAFLVP
jgi:hypothetical protein